MLNPINGTGFHPRNLPGPNIFLHTEVYLKYISLGVNIGNLGRARTAQEPMVTRCTRINRQLVELGIDLHVTAFFRHTGNLVIETATLQAGQAASILSEADGATWLAIAEDAMRIAMEKAHALPPPDPEKGVRWTLGLVFAVTRPANSTISSTNTVRFQPIDLTTVAAWKRDRITEGGRLDNKMREGGWGSVSGVIGDQTSSQWTARSLTSLEGVLNHPTPIA